MGRFRAIYALSISIVLAVGGIAVGQKSASEISSVPGLQEAIDSLNCQIMDIAGLSAVHDEGVRFVDLERLAQVEGHFEVEASREQLTRLHEALNRVPGLREALNQQNISLDEIVAAVVTADDEVLVYYGGEVDFGNGVDADCANDSKTGHRAGNARSEASAGADDMGQAVAGSDDADCETRISNDGTEVEIECEQGPNSDAEAKAESDSDSSSASASASASDGSSAKAEAHAGPGVADEDAEVDFADSDDSETTAEAKAHSESDGGSATASSSASVSSEGGSSSASASSSTSVSSSNGSTSSSSSTSVSVSQSSDADDDDEDDDDVDEDDD